MARTYGERSGHWLKPKVLAGFILLVMFAVTSITVTYRSFSELNITRERLSQPAGKMLEINAIVSDLFAAESDIRSYMLTDNERYLKTYGSRHRLVKRRIEHLLELTADNDDQQKSVERIGTLLDNKQLIVDELVAFRRSTLSDSFYEQALSEVTAVGKSAKPAVAVVKATTITTHKRDTSIKVEDTTIGVFGRIRRFFTGPEMLDTVITRTDVETSYDTIHYGKTVPDSVLRKLEHRINRIRIEQGDYFNNLTNKELLLLESDRQIMEQIRSMITDLKHQELTTTAIHNAETQDMFEALSIKVLVMGAATLILLLLLLAMIFSDISREDVYRAQLVDAKQYAEQLLRTKERFLANMSHEIRTPLSAVIGMVRQMEKNRLPEHLQPQVNVLKSSSDHLLAVINDILDYSKLESGQMSLEAVRFKPAQVVQEVIGTFETRANEKGLELFANIDPLTPGELWGDTFRLRQILINIIGNSLKFTELGSIVVSVAPAKIGVDYVKLQITISDTGVGIPEEHQSLIFDDFTQVDSSVSRKYGGTGLGLAIVKKLVDMQGGELNLNSKPGEGTTISMVIPYALKGVENEEVAKPELLIPAGLRILIVDDDEVNRLIVSEMAKSIGLVPDSIGQPDKLSQMVENQDYRAILTDIQMPGMSGYDLVRLVDQKGWNIPVVAITANSMIDDPAHFASQGFSGYLIKPFDEEALQRALAPILGVPADKSAQPKPAAQKHRKRRSETLQQFDLHEINRFTGGDKNATRAILRSFLDNSYINLDAINEHVRNKQVSQASAVAHKMKAVYKQFRLNRIASLLEKLEHLRPDKLKAAQVYASELTKLVEPLLKDMQRSMESIE